VDAYAVFFSEFTDALADLQEGNVRRIGAEGGLKLKQLRKHWSWKKTTCKSTVV